MIKQLFSAIAYAISDEHDDFDEWREANPDASDDDYYGDDDELEDDDDENS